MVPYLEVLSNVSINPRVLSNISKRSPFVSSYI